MKLGMYIAGEISAADAAALREAGVSFATVAEGIDAEPLRGAGISVRACVSAFALDAPPLVSVTGKSFAYGVCPLSEEARRPIYDKMRALSQTRGFDGVMLDHTRYPSLIHEDGPEAYFTCFCEICRAEMAASGLDVDAVARAVAWWRSLFLTEGLEPEPFALQAHMPHLRAWARFRTEKITRYAGSLAAAYREKGTGSIGAYVFAPSLAPLVAQSYAGLAPVFDEVSPMLYHRYPKAFGPACLDKELAVLLKGYEGRSARGQSVIAQTWQVFSGTSYRGFGEADAIAHEGVGEGVLREELRAAKARCGKTAFRPILLAGAGAKARLALAEEAGASAAELFCYVPGAAEELIGD